MSIFHTKTATTPSRHIIAKTLALLTLIACCSPYILSIQAASTLLPGTKPEMNTAGYWISRHPAPDEIIMDDAAIKAFNQRIEEMGYVQDLTVYKPPKSWTFRQDLRSDARWVKKRGFYRRNGKVVDDRYTWRMIRNMNLKNIPDEVVAKYGFLSAGASMRILPTREGLFEKKGDPFFDHLQVSALEQGEPLRLLHHSMDGEWVFAVAKQVSGWLPSKRVTTTDPKTFFRRYHSKDFVVVTAPRADLFTDAAMTHYFGAVRMGTKLLSGPKSSDNEPAPDGGVSTKITSFPATVPGKDDQGNYQEQQVWIDPAQISDKPLSYTPRHIIRQAFRLLNAPYGWGGMFKEQDCSQFILEVFSTVGIELPRSSRKQIKTGSALSDMDANLADIKKANILIKNGFPGATLLGMPGHIMLYLGDVDGEPYAIHAAFAYREDQDGQDEIRLINRVVVTTLKLGDGSQRGSYIRRLSRATFLGAQTMTP